MILLSDLWWALTKGGWLFFDVHRDRRRGASDLLLDSRYNRYGGALRDKQIFPHLHD